mmetsp:Transcript_15152/g.12889  ORF Transcript_15152/g.12889 Transcript_15152/m.12889 type:complete len:99 (-) Transcript_15152:424-720(-)
MIRSNLTRYFSKDLSIKSVSKRVAQLSYDAMFPFLQGRINPVPVALQYSQFRSQEEIEYNTSPTERVFPSRGLLDVIPSELGERGLIFEENDFSRMRN